MTHTLQLIEKVEFLLQLIAGTDAAESETVKDICDLIGKVKSEHDELGEFFKQYALTEKERKYSLERLTDLMTTYSNLINNKNPKNPE